MSIQFHCPECRALVRVAASAAGKRGRCPHCGHRITIPDAGEDAAATVPGAGAGGTGRRDDGSTDASPARTHSLTPSNQDSAPRPSPGPATAPAARDDGARAGSGSDSTSERREGAGGDPLEEVFRRPYIFREPDRESAAGDRRGSSPPVASPLPHQPPSQGAAPGNIGPTPDAGRSPAPAGPIVPPPYGAQPPPVPFTPPSSPVVPVPPVPTGAGVPHVPPVASPAPLPAGSGLAPAAVPASASTIEPSLSKRLRRQRRRTLQVTIPIFFGAALLAALVWLYWEVTPELAGRLTAERVSEPPPPVLLTGEEFDVPAETREMVLEYLKERPERITTDVMQTEIRGRKQALQIAISSSTRTMFVVVDISQDPLLREFYDEHAEEILTLRERAFRRAGRRFFQSWAELIEARQSPNVELLMEHRNAFALSASVEGLGYIVHAMARDQPYPCVYERDNRLWFLLPRDVKSFLLEGRRMPDGTRPFPGRYTVIIRDAASQTGAGKLSGPRARAGAHEPPEN